MTRSIIALAAALLAGCADLRTNYDRTYSLTVSDKDGRSVGATARFSPRATPRPKATPRAKAGARFDEHGWYDATSGNRIVDK